MNCQSLGPVLALEILTSFFFLIEAPITPRKTVPMRAAVAPAWLSSALRPARAAIISCDDRFDTSRSTARRDRPAPGARRCCLASDRADTPRAQQWNAEWAEARAAARWNSSRGSRDTSRSSAARGWAECRRRLWSCGSTNNRPCLPDHAESPVLAVAVWAATALPTVPVWRWGHPALAWRACRSGLRIPRPEMRCPGWRSAARDAVPAPVRTPPPGERTQTRTAAQLRFSPIASRKLDFRFWIADLLVSSGFRKIGSQFCRMRFRPTIIRQNRSAEVNIMKLRKPQDSNQISDFLIYKSAINTATPAPDYWPDPRCTTVPCCQSRCRSGN